VQSAKESYSLKERPADFTTDVTVVPNQEIQQDIVSSETAGNELGDILFVFHYLLDIYVHTHVTETNYKHKRHSILFSTGMCTSINTIGVSMMLEIQSYNGHAA